MLHTCLELSKKEQIKNYIQIHLWIWKGNTKGYLLLVVFFFSLFGSFEGPATQLLNKFHMETYS